MILLALAAATTLPAPLGVPPVLSVTPKCATSPDTNEIVVCGKPSDQRLEPLSGPGDRPVPRAEAQIAKGVKVGLVAETATVGSGATSNRGMARLKIAF